MSSLFRKMTVGFLSLVLIGMLFWVYLSYFQKDRLEIEEGKSHTNLIDAEDSKFKERVGRIADVGVKSMEEVKYTHLNENKEVDRELGFERLLHEVGDHWELKEPFMNVYQDTFKCMLTADIGKVQVDTALGKPAPKDATLSGNVKIKVIPHKDGNFNELNFFLDDIIYESEKSKFSSSGPVKIISDDLELKGKGFQLVFNANQQRLEYLKIDQLEKLTVKNDSSRPILNSESKKTKKHNHEKNTGMDEDSKNFGSKQLINERPTYQCKLTKNVLIDSSNQLVFASDLIFVESIKIPASDDSDSKSSSGKTSNSDDRSNAKLEEGSLPAKSDGKENIVVTCDGSILIRPEGELNVTPDFPEVESRPIYSYDDFSYQEKVSGKEVVFEAQRIDLNYSQKALVAKGKNRLRIFPQNIENSETSDFDQINITSDDRVTYGPEAKQVSFFKNSECNILSKKPEFDENYILKSKELKINFDSSSDSESPQKIEKIFTEGNKVVLASTKTRDEKVIGGMQMKCNKFDYDLKKQYVLATGPGNIFIDNSNVTENSSSQEAFRAVIRNFKYLKYFTDENKLLAESLDDPLMIDYIPVSEKNEDRPRFMASRSFEANFKETGSGDMELVDVTAENGVTYRDEEIEFAGSDLYFDVTSSLLSINGSENYPCLLNGSLVESIKYDVSKEELIKAEIERPGLFN